MDDNTSSAILFYSTNSLNKFSSEMKAIVNKIVVFSISSVLVVISIQFENIELPCDVCSKLLCDDIGSLNEFNV